MRGKMFIRVGMVVLICGLASAMAVSAATASTLGPVVEGGFRLRGSHGYSISVVAYAEEGSDKGLAEIVVSRRGARVSYRAPAIMTTGSIKADFGGIGRIDVVRQPLGYKKTVHPKCLGGSQTYERGNYEGVIEFNGEHGYTRVRASQVEALPAWLVFSTHGTCGGGYGESSGPGIPGARLRGLSFAGGQSLSFQVNKNRREARVVFTATLKERRRGIRIDRELSGAAPSQAFRFDPQLRTATLSPPAPFTGSASVSRSPNSFTPIWKGNLRIDFPGRPNVSLVGPEVHVGLVHARFTRSKSSEITIGT